MSGTASRRFVRPDAWPKTTGEARYTADLRRPGMLAARLLYAGHASARIRTLDVERARRLPGVLAVLTQADLPPRRYGHLVEDRTLFADGVVRFDGEVMAAVAAVSAELADEACALIDLDLEPIDPVLDPEAALAADAPLVHAAWACYGSPVEGLDRRGNDCGHVTIVKGDAAAALAAADVVLEETFASDMSHPVPIEPHAIVAEWDGDRVTIWTTSQTPFQAREGVAYTLDVPESRVRVIVPHLGGGFGGKCDFHFEAHVAALARAARRPVRLVLSRRDEFTVTDMVRHPIRMRLTTGVRRDGTIVARRARLVLDTGAYAAHGPAISEVATMMAVGPYRIPHLDIEAHTVYTNRMPAGSTRAPSGPQMCWAVEQHTDALARRVGLTPYRFRELNLVGPGDEGPTGQRFDAVGVQECLREAARLIDLDAPRDADEGVGLACAWWFSYPSPSSASARLNTDGTLTLVTGAQENGSGAVMGLALLAAGELGLDPEQVGILLQDTDSGQWDYGSAGSQTTFNAGRAVLAVARDLRDQLLDRAAAELEIDPRDLELANGAVRARGAPERHVTVSDLAASAFADGVLLHAGAAPEPPPLPENFGSSCTGRALLPAFGAPSFGCHAARVRVEHETGIVRVEHVCAVHEIGRVLNPPGAHGQIEGGVVHSVGMALSEGTQFDGARQRNANLLDYKLQTAADAPRITVGFVEKPTPDGPNGAKGLGEPPVIPTAAAIANAIRDATGVGLRQLPMLPERVWAALRDHDEARA